MCTLLAPGEEFKAVRPRRALRHTRSNKVSSFLERVRQASACYTNEHGSAWFTRYDRKVNGQHKQQTYNRNQCAHHNGR